jgi:uncharacterized protein (DUF1330 family)
MQRNTMHPIMLTEADLTSAERRIPPGTPVVMLNLVAFNSRALYEDASIPPCSGREAYLQRYAPAFREAAAVEGVAGIKPLYVGGVATTIIGPAEPGWDAVVLVEYPNFEALRKVLQSPFYKSKAEPHRKAALRAWQFIATVQPR